MKKIALSIYNIRKPFDDQNYLKMLKTYVGLVFFITSFVLSIQILFK